MGTRQPRATGARRHQRLGQSGEELAARWYRAQGYEIVARNWRCRAGEIDIVARQGDLTVFCEVKTRTSTRFGLPVEAVGAAKQLRARRLAAAWFAGRPAPSVSGHRGGPVRFDVASVLGGELEVLEAAF